MNIFQKSAQRLPLTPAERAFLTFFWHLLLTTVTNALLALSQIIFLYLYQGGDLAHFQWSVVIVLQLWSILAALLAGLRKYTTANVDKAYAAPIASVIDQTQQIVQQAIQAASQQGITTEPMPQMAQMAQMAPVPVSQLDTLTNIEAVREVK